MRKILTSMLVCFLLVFILSLMVSHSVLAAKSSTRLPAPEWLPGSPSVADTFEAKVLHAQWTSVEGAAGYRISLEKNVRSVVYNTTTYREEIPLGNGTWRIYVQAFDSKHRPGMTLLGVIQVVSREQNQKAKNGLKEVVPLTAPEWHPGYPRLADTLDPFTKSKVLHARWTSVEGAHGYRILINTGIVGSVWYTTTIHKDVGFGKGQWEVYVQAFDLKRQMGPMSRAGFIQSGTLEEIQATNKRHKEDEKRRKWAPVRYGAYFGFMFFLWGLFLSGIGVKTRRNRILAITLPYPILILVFFKPLFIYGPYLAFLIIIVYVPVGIVASLIGFGAGLIAKRYNPDL